MQSNNFDKQFSRVDVQLSQPHFEEEATLLSARPVVPLDDLGPETTFQKDPGAKTNSRKRLAFGLTMVCAVLAGAFGALVFTRYRQPAAVTESVAQVSEPDAFKNQLVAGVAGGIARDAISDPHPQPAPEKITPPEREDPKDNVAVELQKPKHLPIRARQADERLSNEQSDEMDDTELRREERREARRLRRVEEREELGDRKRGKRGTDGVLRIRDIFEGTRRRPSY